MLPSPLPDDPRKWDGWNRYNSENFYERLCLTFESRPTNEQIEENCRLLQVWWQKKLPLKNQPSNPLAQMLRGGMDLAPRYIAQARTELLNPERRAQIDAALQDSRRGHALAEFQKFLDFAVSDKVLTLEEEANLLKLGHSLGLGAEDVALTIQQGLKTSGAQREADLPPPPEAVPVPPLALVSTTDERPRTRRVRAATPAEEFRRMLQLSGLDTESMSDDRRDTFIDMAENMGLEAGQAEDLVDEYLEAIEDGTLQVRPRGGNAEAGMPTVTAKPITQKMPVAAAKPPVAKAPQTAAVTPAIKLDPKGERLQFQDFHNSLRMEMRFLPSAAFALGSSGPSAPGNEGPVTRVTLSRFYLSRFPVTNADYEQFDPSHRSRRGSWADGQHPVIYVSSLDADKFCQWLSVRERKKYRLPTEAEWEYAAKGAEGFTYPWGDATGLGTVANFADVNTTFAWRDPNVNDGYAETNPVGKYPAGKSRANVEDLAGNVWEWCQDWYAPYSGRDCVNPRGPKHGTQRVYRGGSWKSRFASLKTTARGFNLPGYASNDVGFRVVCECE